MKNQKFPLEEALKVAFYSAGSIRYGEDKKLHRAKSHFECATAISRHCLIIEDHQNTTEFDLN